MEIAICSHYSVTPASSFTTKTHLSNRKSYGFSASFFKKPFLGCTSSSTKKQLSRKPIHNSIKCSVSQATETETSAGAALPLQDRVAIVTGSSRGIGKAIALHLASLGAKLLITYTSDPSQADLVASQINNAADPLIDSDDASVRAISLKADVSNQDNVASLFDAAELAFSSPVHILVNSAGVLNPKYPTISNTTLEDFDKTFSVNTRGSFICCKEAANRIKRGGGGRIICLTSSLAATLRPGSGVYAASKAAIEVMVKILAKELKGTGITANCVAPGPVATDMFFAGKTEEMVQNAIRVNPLQRLGKPEDVATLVGFLVGDTGEWVNGQVVRVNGGYI